MLSVHSEPATRLCPADNREKLLRSLFKPVVVIWLCSYHVCLGIKGTEK